MPVTAPARWRRSARRWRFFAVWHRTTRRALRPTLRRASTTCRIVWAMPETAPARSRRSARRWRFIAVWRRRTPRALYPPVSELPDIFHKQIADFRRGASRLVWILLPSLFLLILLLPLSDGNGGCMWSLLFRCLRLF